MRRILGVMALCLAAAGGPALAANPFAPAITVNNGVITQYDIEQRMKLLEALGASADLRKLAVQQLTEDRVKKQAAKDMDIELPEGAIEQGVDEFATGRGLTTDDVNHVLEVRGIDVQTMNDFVESGLLWREVVGTALPRPRPAVRGGRRRGARGAPDPAAGNADARRDRAALRGARRGRDRGARRQPLPPDRPRRELLRPRLRVQPQPLGRARRPARSGPGGPAPRRLPHPGAAPRPGAGDAADPDLRRPRAGQARLDRPPEAAADPRGPRSPPPARSCASSCSARGSRASGRAISRN